ncbi:hypothetical protein SSX86_002791 [Deinandra increscens subsp. villosa]|uniref:EFR3-like protein n=1 Tax=Deinandra increscens subsp. villosa TaxID=3103831 RepID=A0AAP0H9X8_9ASTR
MGVISRRVLPVCSILCVCCPSLRARSRHPVKRYKKLLADIFPRSQGGEPNERKIGKLCEYASRNPLRIPKITDYLEQKFYKNLRNENITAVKAVLLVYGKLLSYCKQQMPLFASSFLDIIGTLLVQTQHHEMQILGCNALVNFINNQVDTAYMFNLEGLIPKLCQLAEEVGDDERVLRLRSAGLEVLAFMVRFLGEQPHVSMDLENIISVTLENYTDIQMNQEINSKDAPPVDAHNNPSHWARICLHNMAQSATGVTNVRRVLEPIFHKFDTDKLWLPEKGVAFSVLKYLLTVLEESDDRSHLLFPILVKHLESKHVTKQPVLQLQIVNVATQLSGCVKQQASVTIVGAISDLIKHLRKCIQRPCESSSPREGSDSSYIDLQSGLENCISNLSCKVGDVGPILDTMATVLENIPSSATMARANISAIYRTAQVISSIPNKTYLRKVFPDALFHHLLLAMSHPDHETRVLAHRVLFIVLIPSLSQSWSIQDLIPSQAGFPTNLSADGCNKSILETIDEETVEKEIDNIENHKDDATKSLSCGSNDTSTCNGNTASSSMRLSGHQVSLVLSSIWIQATSMENNPENFVAMGHTYTLALSFVLSKNPNHVGLLQFFQLAFSLRSISLNRQGDLEASQKRPMFTLASYMIIVSASACHLPELVSLVRSTLIEETVDPYLVLDEDDRLQVVCKKPGDKNCYESQADEASTMESLSAIESKDQELKDTLSTHLVSCLGKSSEEDVSNMKAQLSQWFLPDDEYPMGVQLFMGTQRSFSAFSQMDIQAFDEVKPHDDSANEDPFDQCGSQSDPKAPLDIISVSQLLESVVETAHDVESMPNNSSLTLSFDEIKNQCEALVMGKQQKMSVLQSFKDHEEAMAITTCGEYEKHSPSTSNNQWELEKVDSTSDRTHPVFSCLHEYGQQESFRLPAVSPYDKFLKPSR